MSAAADEIRDAEIAELQSRVKRLEERLHELLKRLPVNPTHAPPAPVQPHPYPGAPAHPGRPPEAPQWILGGVDWIKISFPRLDHR